MSVLRCALDIRSIECFPDSQAAPFAMTSAGPTDSFARSCPKRPCAVRPCSDSVALPCSYSHCLPPHKSRPAGARASRSAAPRLTPCCSLHVAPCCPARRALLQPARRALLQPTRRALLPLASRPAALHSAHPVALRPAATTTAAAAARATAAAGGGAAGSAGSAAGAGGAGGATGSAGSAAGAGGAGPTTDRHCLSWPLSRQLQRLGVGIDGHCLSRTTPPLSSFASGFFSKPQSQKETFSPQVLSEFFPLRCVTGSVEAAAIGASDSAAALGDSESATALGASESAAALGARASPATGPSSGLHLPTFLTNLVSIAAIQDVWVDTFIPGVQRVAISQVAESGQMAASSQESASGQLAASCSCWVLSHQTLLWQHRLGHTSLPRLRSMHSRLLVSGLPRSLPSLPRSTAPPCLPCVEGRQRAAPQSSEFPLTTALLQTLHMDTRYTTVFPLRRKADVSSVLIPWIRATHRQLRERFSRDFPVLRLHSDRGGEFSSDLLAEFCQDEGIHQTFTLLASPQQNGIAECRIGLIMELNLSPRVFEPETSPTLRWTGKVGDALVFRGPAPSGVSQVDPPPLVEPLEISSDYSGLAEGGDPAADDTATTRHSPRLETPRSFLPRLSLLPPQLAAVDPGAETAGAVSGGAETEDEGSGGVATGGAATGGADSGGAPKGGAGSWGAVTWGADSGGPTSPSGGGAVGDPAGGPGAGQPPQHDLLETLSPHAIRVWIVRRGSPGGGGYGPAGARVASLGGTAGAGGTGGTAGAGGAGSARAGGTTGAGVARGATGPAGTRGAGAAGAGGAAGAESAGGATGATGTGGAGGTAGAAGAGGAGAASTALRRPFFYPRLQLSLPPPDSVLRQVLSLLSSTGLPLPFLYPLTDQSQPQLLPGSPLPKPAPPTEVNESLTERREPETCASTLCVVLPEPLASSLLHIPDPKSNPARAASPTVTRLLTTVVTDPDFESTAAFALVLELIDFAATSRVNYVASLVTESESVCPPSVGVELALGNDVVEDRQFELECLATALPRFASMLLCPEGDPDALDIPTPRSYALAIAGEYSSHWQTAMDAEMASWKSTCIYVDEVPPPGANIVDGMWIFRVKRPPGSPPAFKALYVARGFSQRQGVDFFHTFSPTPKMTTLWVLLHFAAQHDYELHSLDFSTAFLLGNLHEEIWLRRTPRFTGSFLAGTQWSLRRPVYSLRQAPQEWHDTLRTTLAALGFAPSSTDPSLFLRIDTTLPPFYVQVYVDDLVFATGVTEALALVKAELQETHTCTDLGPLALRLQVLLATAHSSVYRPLALSSTFGRVRRAEWSVPRACGLPHGSVVLTGHSDASWADDKATQHSSQGYTFSLGSGSVSWRSTRSSSVLSSSCEAKIYAGAMAAQELHWLTYLLTDLGERPRSPPVVYVDNKAMLALCHEQRLEHRTKHIALRYFLASELQQRRQLRLCFVASRANIADVFTKALGSGDHHRFCTALGLVPILPHLLVA
ncbi:unnamed protein product [Closterium sp. NIES-54]